jgi:chromosome partitioning protein
MYHLHHLQHLRELTTRGRRMTSLKKVLDNHMKVVEEGYTAAGGLKYKSYAISTLRGGVGKSTLAFNLAYEMAVTRPMLVADLCAQCNLTEAIMKEADSDDDVTILDALQPVLLGPAFGVVPDDLSYRISTYCDAFKTTKRSFLRADGKKEGVTETAGK